MNNDNNNNNTERSSGLCSSFNDGDSSSELKLYAEMFSKFNGDESIINQDITNKKNANGGSDGFSRTYLQDMLRDTLPHSSFTGNLVSRKPQEYGGNDLIDPSDMDGLFDESSKNNSIDNMLLSSQHPSSLRHDEGVSTSQVELLNQIHDNITQNMAAKSFADKSCLPQGSSESSTLAFMRSNESIGEANQDLLDMDMDNADDTESLECNDDKTHESLDRIANLQSDSFTKILKNDNHKHRKPVRPLSGRKRCLPDETDNDDRTTPIVPVIMEKSLRQYVHEQQHNLSVIDAGSGSLRTSVSSLQDQIFPDQNVQQHQQLFPIKEEKDFDHTPSVMSYLEQKLLEQHGHEQVQNVPHDTTGNTAFQWVAGFTSQGFSATINNNNVEKLDLGQAITQQQNFGVSSGGSSGTISSNNSDDSNPAQPYTKLWENLTMRMQLSQKSQRDIQDWDKKMSLRRSHSVMMTKSTQSRKSLREAFQNIKQKTKHHPSR